MKYLNIHLNKVKCAVLAAMLVTQPQKANIYLLGFILRKALCAIGTFAVLRFALMRSPVTLGTQNISIDSIIYLAVSG